MPFEDTPQIEAIAETAGEGNLLNACRALFQTLSGAVQTPFFDKFGRRNTGLTREHAGKVSWTHGNPFGQFLNGKIFRQIFQDPALEIADWAGGFSLI
jgi:hypothetical protein